jgi:hypothetical protein
MTKTLNILCNRSNITTYVPVVLPVITISLDDSTSTRTSTCRTKTWLSTKRVLQVPVQVVPLVQVVEAPRCYRQDTTRNMYILHKAVGSDKI